MQESLSFFKRGAAEHAWREGLIFILFVTLESLFGWGILSWIVDPLPDTQTTGMWVTPTAQIIHREKMDVSSIQIPFEDFKKLAFKKPYIITYDKGWDRGKTPSRFDFEANEVIYLYGTSNVKFTAQQDIPLGNSVRWVQTGRYNARDHTFRLITTGSDYPKIVVILLGVLYFAALILFWFINLIGKGKRLMADEQTAQH